MHGRIYQWLARTLAVAAICGASVAARGQEDRRRPSRRSRRRTTRLLKMSGADASWPGRPRCRIGKGPEEDGRQGQGRQREGGLGIQCTPCGRIQVDTANFSQVGNYAGWTMATRPEPNGIEFRRLYLSLEGRRIRRRRVQSRVRLRRHKHQSGDTTPTIPRLPARAAASIQAKDIYLQINELPMVGHVRIGNFYEPFGLEATTSDIYHDVHGTGQHRHDLARPPHRHHGLRPHHRQREYPLGVGRLLLGRRRRRHDLPGQQELHGHDAGRPRSSGCPGTMRPPTAAACCTWASPATTAKLGPTSSRWPAAPTRVRRNRILGLPYNFTMTDVDHFSPAWRRIGLRLRPVLRAIGIRRRLRHQDSTALRIPSTPATSK